MGKKDRDFRDFEESMEKLQERKRQLEKEEKQLRIRCSHQNNRRKLKIKPISDIGDYKCRKCGEEFNMNTISLTELRDAIETVHNSIQQIRCFADPDEDRKIIRLLGESDFNNEEIAKIYERTYETFGKNNKKKNKFRDKDEFGSYGVDRLSFINSKKKRK